MNLKKYALIKPIVALVVLTLITFNQWRCSSKQEIPSFATDTINTNSNEEGHPLIVSFKRGNAYNHPVMAIWITDTNNTYIETLFITKSIAKGIFDHADKSSGKWTSAPLRRPATLPVWSHSRGVKEIDNLYIPTPDTPMPDAVTGATPQYNFVLHTRTSKNIPNLVYVYFEINQTWDWNEYWTNDKFPEDDDYKTSCQPSLIYRATINLSDKNESHTLEPIGHGHYSGKDGSINPDLSTITTAKEITSSIQVITQN